MEGKKITKVLEFGNGYTALMLGDDEVAIVKVVTPDFPLDELAEFAGAVKSEAKAEPKKKGDPEPEPEDENDGDVILEDLQGMNYKKLSKFCYKNNMELDPEDFDDDEEPELRQAIAKELGLEVTAETGSEIDEDSETGSEIDDVDDDYTWADLEKMDYDELKELCDENDTNTDPEDFEEDEEVGFRRAIAKEFGIEAPKKKKKKKK